MKSGESYQENLIERLKNFYESILKEMEDEYRLSKEISTDSAFHQNMGDMACKLAIRFKSEFEQELKG